MRHPGALIALALAGLGGCGGSSSASPSPEAQVRAVAVAYGRAVARKDYQTICDRLIATRLSDAVESVGLPCELVFRRGLEAVVRPTLTVRSVRVTGATARVAVHTTAAGQPPADVDLELVRQGRGWRISALGGGSAGPPATTASTTSGDD